MISNIEAWILGTLQTLFEAWGWAGVAGMMAFENFTGITPSEITLALAGWLLISENELPLSVIFLGGFYAALGSVLGASGTYWVARLGGRPLVERMAKWVRIQPLHITRTEQQFHRWGTGLVLIGRVIPGVRTLVSIPAGLARMNFIAFLGTTFIGAYIWCTMLIGAGYLLGHEWPIISSYVKQAFPFLAATGAFVLAAYFLIAYRARLLAWVKIRNSD